MTHDTWPFLQLCRRQILFNLYGNIVSYYKPPSWYDAPYKNASQNVAVPHINQFNTLHIIIIDFYLYLSEHLRKLLHHSMQCDVDLNHVITKILNNVNEIDFWAHSCKSICLNLDDEFIVFAVPASLSSSSSSSRQNSNTNRDFLSSTDICSLHNDFAFYMCLPAFSLALRITFKCCYCVKSHKLSEPS